MLHRYWCAPAFLWTVAVLISSKIQIEALKISDEDRKAGYAARNYTWPIPEGQIQPNTPGWVDLMRMRMRQMEALETDNPVEKYDGWRSTVGQALTVPNFTQFGWAITKSPSDLSREIVETLRDNFHNQYGEGNDPAIVGEHEPVMVDMPEVVDKALDRLQPFLETWSGVKLRPIKAYGLRLYPNTSRLYMHLDKIETHIISCILHIDRSVDAKPWPLVIEDLEGTTQHVYLNHGDMLMYESAKCLHGRPIPFEGSWYTSLFLHYAPIEWLQQNQDHAAQYAIPDHWEEVRPYDQTQQDNPQHHGNPPRLTMVDTAMIEPDCPNKWCGSHPIATWEGQAKYGIAISSHGVEKLLNLPEMERDRDEL